MLDSREQAASDYTTRYGWTTTVVGDHVMLRLDAGLATVILPASWAGEVSHHLTCVNRRGPILALPERPGRWAFLVRADGSPPGHQAVPPGVRVLLSHQEVPLPPSRLDAGEVRWVVSPRTEGGDLRGELPTIATLKCAIRAVRRTWW